MIALESVPRRWTSPARTSPSAGQLARRLRDYFNRHPEASREQFLLHALQQEIDSREPGSRRGTVRRYRVRPLWWDDDRRPLTPEDIRIHAWLNRRLARLPRRRRGGFWSGLRRLLSRNPLTGWLIPRRS